MTWTLSTLVDDVIIQILTTLAVSDILNIRLTSKRLETLSRLTNVWYSVFIREVLACGRPIPGYSIPRNLPLSVDSERPHRRISTVHAEGLFESADLEARTLLALRLDKRWCKSGSSTPNADTAVTTTTFDPLSTSPFTNVFLLPGGRYLVLVHTDGLRLWDLGFSVSSAFRNIASTPSMMETWLFNKLNAGAAFNVACDAATRSPWGGKARFIFSYCTEPSDVQTVPRAVSVVSLSHASLKLWNNDVNIDVDIDATSSPASRAFNLERDILLPPSLPPPRDSGVPPGTSVNYGTLGRLLHMHSKFLLFESFAPIPTTNANSTNNRPRDQYVGIEVLDWSNPETMSNTTLLVYPGPEVGAFIDMYVQECTQHIIVMWRNCMGVYPLRETVDNAAFTLGRIVLFPTIIFALAEEVTKPIAFTPCISSKEAALGPTTAARFTNLTIVAQPAGRPLGTVQSILTTRASALSSGTTALEYSFRLTRVPTRDRFGGSSQTSTLALGPSGRGLRAEDDGALYSCSPSSMLIPSLQVGPNRVGGGVRHAGGQEDEDFSRGLVKTIDFWPYRKVGDVAIPHDKEGESNTRLTLRFDDGMGRAVYTYISDGGRGSPSPQTLVTILDFA